MTAVGLSSVVSSKLNVYLQTHLAMLESDFFIPIIISVVTALLIGGLYLFSIFFRDGEDE